MDNFADKVRAVIESGLTVTSREKVSESVLFILDLAQSWEEKHRRVVELEERLAELDEEEAHWPHTFVMNDPADQDNKDTPWGWMHRAINAEYQVEFLTVALADKQAQVDDLEIKITLPSKEEFIAGVRETAETAHRWIIPTTKDELVGAADMALLFEEWDEATRGKQMSDASGRVIYKYQMPVLEQFQMTLPQGAKILRMADDNGMFWLWAEVDTNAPAEVRKFRSYKCGGQMPADVNLVYIGFCAVYVQMELGLYIYEEV